MVIILDTSRHVKVPKGEKLAITSVLGCLRCTRIGSSTIQEEKRATFQRESVGAIAACRCLVIASKRFRLVPSTEETLYAG